MKLPSVLILVLCTYLIGDLAIDAVKAGGQQMREQICTTR
jgi:hypothetical protein